MMHREIVVDVVVVDVESGDLRAKKNVKNLKFDYNLLISVFSTIGRD